MATRWRQQDGRQVDGLYIPVASRMLRAHGDTMAGAGCGSYTREASVVWVRWSELGGRVGLRLRGVCVAGASEGAFRLRAGGGSQGWRGRGLRLAQGVTSMVRIGHSAARIRDSQKPCNPGKLHVAMCSVYNYKATGTAHIAQIGRDRQMPRQRAAQAAARGPGRGAARATCSWGTGPCARPRPGSRLYRDHAYRVGRII